MDRKDDSEVNSKPQTPKGFNTKTQGRKESQG